MCLQYVYATHGIYIMVNVFYTEFTAAAVWTNYQLFIKPHIKSEEAAGYDLFVSGGGAKNTAIMR